MTVVRGGAHADPVTSTPPSPRTPPSPSTPTKVQQRVDALLGPAGPLAAGRHWRDRPEQRALACSIAQAIESGSVFVAEAGTGIGKTYAYLVPALLAGGKVIVSTGSKTLQDQLFTRDLPQVVEALELDVQCALLKGRANYVCRHHLRRHLADGRFARATDVANLRRIDRFSRLTRSGDRAECSDVADDDPVWAFATSTRDNCLGQECADWNECFVVQARRAAQSADVVVVNHHLFAADLALRDTGIAELLPTAQTLIFDEAHQLAQTLIAFLGEAIGSRAVLDLVRDTVQCGHSEAPDQARWDDLAAQVEQSVRSVRAAWPPGALRSPFHRLREPGDFLESLQALLVALQSLTRVLESARERGPNLAKLAPRASELTERLRAWLADGADEGEAVSWAEVFQSAFTLHRTPLSVAQAFSRHREGAERAWIFVSATLSVGGDLGHFVKTLGLDGAHAASFPSPFDYARQGLLYIPKGLPEPTNPAFTLAWIDDCWPLIETNMGRCFVLCTTHRAVKIVADRLRNRIEPPMTLLVQGEGSRSELLERYRRSVAPVLVGAASFWEGVDVVGNALSLLLIDKLPFAPPDDPVLEARSESLRRQGIDPFRAVQIPEAAIALKQGAGRLIRSESDRGVLGIGDSRLLSRGYGKALLASLPPFSQTRDPAQAMAFLLEADHSKSC